MRPPCMEPCRKLREPLRGGGRERCQRRRRLLATQFDGALDRHRKRKPVDPFDKFAKPCMDRVVPRIFRERGDQLGYSAGRSRNNAVRSLGQGAACKTVGAAEEGEWLLAPEVEKAAEVLPIAGGILDAGEAAGRDKPARR